MAKFDKIKENKYEQVASDENEKVDPIPPKYGYGVRHIQVLLIFCSLCINFIARAHLSVTIVAMAVIPTEKDTIVLNNTTSDNFTSFSAFELKITSHNSDTEVNDTDIDSNKNGFVIDSLDTGIKGNNTFDDKDGLNKNRTVNKRMQKNTNIDKSIWNVYKIYVWSKPVQDTILGSFFLGYMIMMSPMGLVCQRWGGKLPLQIGLSVSGVLTVVTPWLAAWGDWKAVCATRVAMGLAQAGTYPSINTLVAKWVPLSERGRLGTYVYIGSMVGAVLAFQVGGFLADTAIGWPSTFWVTGSLCIVMAILFTVFGAASPQQHKSITDEERNFILGRTYTGVEKRPKTPWKAILTSKPVWASFVAHIGSTTMYLFFFAQIPTYLHHVLKVDIKNSGVLTSLPYLGNLVVSIIVGQACDYCIDKKVLTLRQIRIISNNFGTVVPAIFLAVLSFTSNTVLSVIFLVLALTTHAGIHTGWMLNYIDLAPNFSGTLMATGNTIMNVNALLLPVFVSQIVTDVTNPVQWRIVMISVAAFGSILNAVYICFMSTDVQPWNDPEYHTHTAVHDKEATEASKKSEEKCKI